jgi:hypothetical protein
VAHYFDLLFFLQLDMFIINYLHLQNLISLYSNAIFGFFFVWLCGYFEMLILTCYLLTFLIKILLKIDTMINQVVKMNSNQLLELLVL